MKEETQRQEELQQAIETPENFFRDVEIEFLIHELKDPLAIIETGLRTIGTPSGKNTQTNVEKFEKSPPDAQQSAGNWTIRSRLFSQLSLSACPIGLPGPNRFA
jgi:hypothetical protein